jgi:hypothetical protein
MLASARELIIRLDDTKEWCGHDNRAARAGRYAVDRSRDVKREKLSSCRIPGASRSRRRGIKVSCADVILSLGVATCFMVDSLNLVIFGGHGSAAISHLRHDIPVTAACVRYLIAWNGLSKVGTL